MEKTLIRPFDIFTDFDSIFNSNSHFYSPSTDVIENDEKYEIQLFMPACNKEDFDVKVEKDVLIITGERKRDENIKYNSRESYIGKYKKTFKMPDFIDRDKIDAEYKDGVLIVSLPKSQEKLQKKTIIIK